MSVLRGIAQDFLGKIKPEDVRSVLDGSLNRCESEGCDKLSPGVRCKCGRFVCRSHGFLAIEYPPRPICMECILEQAAEEEEEG